MNTPKQDRSPLRSGDFPARSTTPAAKRTIPSWTLLGRAIADYHRGDWPARLDVIQEDGEPLPLYAGHFFRTVSALPPAETMALDLARGRVLDAGAGAGCHALLLQECGHDVTALDRSPEAVRVMRERGVRDAVAGDVFDIALPRRYDTLLLLMNGIGLAGDLAGLDRLLDRVRALLAPDAQILLDSTDLAKIDNALERERIARRERRGRYGGETLQRISYHGRLGDLFPWLYLDPATLATRARAAGWASQVVYESSDGTYLARLVSTS